MIFPFTAGIMSDFMILIHLTRLGYVGQCGSKKGPFFSAGPFCPKALGNEILTVRGAYLWVGIWKPGK
jgi:hypothetical protein